MNHKTIACAPTNPEMLLGISQYLRVKHPDYSLRQLRLSNVTDILMESAGVIAHVGYNKGQELFKSTGIPVVNTSGNKPMEDFSTVHVDDADLTKRAMAHLLHQGYRHLAIISRDWEGFTLRRTQAFKKCAEEMKIKDTSVFLAEHHLSTVSQRKKVIEWIHTLKWPVGIVGATEDIANELLFALNIHNIRIPEDIAIISLGDNELINESLRPTMSAIPLPWQRMGYKAAELLFEHLEGKRTDPVMVQVEPQHIFVRQSTNYFAVEDPLLREALSLIANHAHESWNVDDLLNALSVSRSVLQSRFHEELGRSPLQEIHRQRVERAKLLLRETTLPVTSIALQCGFNNKVRFAAVFRKWTSMTATEYRASIS